MRTSVPLDPTYLSEYRETHFLKEEKVPTFLGKDEKIVRRNEAG
jgi:hypothetical protein